MFDNCSVFIFLVNPPPAKDCSEMVTRRFILGAVIGTLLVIAAVQARSPERPAVARPACIITGIQRNDVLRGTNRADVICGRWQRHHLRIWWQRYTDWWQRQRYALATAERTALQPIFARAQDEWSLVGANPMRPSHGWYTCTHGVQGCYV
jgi:hypothetical protein